MPFLNSLIASWEVRQEHKKTPHWKLGPISPARRLKNNEAIQEMTDSLQPLLLLNIFFIFCVFYFSLKALNEAKYVFLGFFNVRHVVANLAAKYIRFRYEIVRRLYSVLSHLNIDQEFYLW